MRRRKLLLGVAAAAAALTALTAVILYNYKQEQARPSPLEVNAWVTTGDQSSLLAPQEPFLFRDSADTEGETAQSGLPVITVNPDQEYQTMDGFGASVTGSSAFLINQRMAGDQRNALMKDLFSPEGIRLSFVRHSVGASDFSVDADGNPASYTYDDTESGEDYALEQFSTAKDKDVTELLRRIVDANETVKVMGTPWTAPPWMKYGEQIHNGWYLNYAEPRVYSAYAQYLARYIKDYEKLGIPVYALTVQNEPEFTTADYPSMSMGAEEQAYFIGNYLGPEFQRQGITSKIVAFDHNWDIAESYVQTVLGDAKANAYTDGTAYHCYAGSPEVMSKVHDAHPGKEIYVTECSGGAWSEDFGDNLAWLMSKLIIGGPRNWAQAVLLWNLALDPEGGPANGGCSNCRGVVTVDGQGKAGYSRNVEYYALGHASRFIDPGAVRIGSPQAGGIENVAYRNPDGSIVLIALNPSDEDRTFNVQWSERTFSFTLKARSAVTFKWQP
ncbi:glycoside hydrolase family 30 beta sandwich domain-containing protein [Paenibacillus sp. DMB5]|uniref:glycoside hydrolase family 30 protein n=1 Tax=Paenibacillus sp. DMB5 TaxID=1780103 RepID=UPI00076C5212|nr:glycoside hydrolase family 30 beta sandwich domain-containing protein [Paenibacillus sp. DMB5]KUP23537.1 beta-1,6-glucanase [Paenibacillus sp. DMB5]